MTDFIGPRPGAEADRLAHAEVKRLRQRCAELEKERDEAKRWGNFHDLQAQRIMIERDAALAELAAWKQTEWPTASQDPKWQWFNERLQDAKAELAKVRAEIADVRAGYANWEEREEAKAERDAVRQELEKVKAERDALEKHLSAVQGDAQRLRRIVIACDLDALNAMRVRAEAAEAELEKVKAERDEARKMRGHDNAQSIKCNGIIREQLYEAQQRAEAAEGEAKRLRRLLTMAFHNQDRWWCCGGSDESPPEHTQDCELRAALAPAPKKEEPQAVVTASGPVVVDEPAPIENWDGTEETPAEHFRRCGPFCEHVKACPDCANVHGLCDEHRDNPDTTWTWKEPKPEPPPCPNCGTHCTDIMNCPAFEDKPEPSEADPIAELGALLKEAGLAPYVHPAGCSMKDCGCAALSRLARKAVATARRETWEAAAVFVEQGWKVGRTERELCERLAAALRAKAAEVRP